MNDFRKLRLGLTMRKADATAYHEPRDGLARDWAEFMSEALPGAAWTPLPNTGDAVLEHVRAFGLNGFILTGGDDPGAYPERDATEAALADFALVSKLPLFGVCRGLQFLHRRFGGKLSPCPEGHVAATHAVRISANTLNLPPGNVEVNSFHRFGIPASELAPPLSAFAATADGWVEGAAIPGLPVAAVMWHPERGRPFRDADMKLVRTLFAPHKAA